MLPATRSLLPLVLALAACVSSNDLHESGVLGDTSSFESRGPDLLVQLLASDEQLATYKRVRIDRVHVFFEPGSAGRALPASSQRLLAKRFGKALRSEVGEHYELVQDLGLVQDDVLRIRVTLTEVNLAHTDSDEVANATVEVEVVDALTGQRVAAAVSRRSARETPSSADDGLDEADHAFGQWALNLREWLDTFMSS